MRKIHVRFTALFIAVLFVLSLGACGNSEPSETSETTVQTTAGTTETETEALSTLENTSSEEEASRFVTGSVVIAETTEALPEENEPSAPVNHLTGLPLAEGENALFRPIAFSVNNLKVAARYHSGLSSADIIYEVEVEGGITRLVAVFSNTENVGKIGSIRSARPVMNCIVLGHDAYFVHSGGSDQAYSELSQYGIPDIDGMKKYAGYFYYDDAVVSASSLEHGYFINGEKAKAAIEAYLGDDGRSEVKEGYDKLFCFYPEASALPGGLPCAEIETSYGSHYKPRFVYDPESGKYGREQYGAAHVDSANGEQLMFDNVIVLSVESSVIKGDKAGRRDFDDVGSGCGILASKGTYINIMWEKESYTSPLVLTAEDGSPLTVNTGKTFISYVNGEDKITVSAE